MGAVNIKGIDKAELLAALYNRARSFGMGLLHYTPEDMAVKEAQVHLKEGDDHRKMFGDHGSSPMYFDYLKGRVMKVDLASDEIRTDLYNRDNGDGACEEVIRQLTEK